MYTPPPIANAVNHACLHARDAVGFSSRPALQLAWSRMIPVTIGHMIPDSDPNTLQMDVIAPAYSEDKSKAAGENPLIEIPGIAMEKLIAAKVQNTEEEKWDKKSKTMAEGNSPRKTIPFLWSQIGTFFFLTSQSENIPDEIREIQRKIYGSIERSPCLEDLNPKTVCK